MIDNMDEIKCEFTVKDLIFCGLLAAILVIPSSVGAAVIFFKALDVWVY